jgi:hypothetical protein
VSQVTHKVALSSPGMNEEIRHFKGNDWLAYFKAWLLDHLIIQKLTRTDIKLIYGAVDMYIGTTVDQVMIRIDDYKTFSIECEETE